MPNILSNYVTFPCVGMVKSQLYVFHPIDLRFLKRLNFSYLIIVFKSNLGPGCHIQLSGCASRAEGNRLMNIKVSVYHRITKFFHSWCWETCCFRHPNRMISLNLGINSYDSCSAVCCDAIPLACYSTGNS